MPSLAIAARRREERSQSVARLAITLVVTAVLLALQALRQGEPSPGLTAALVVVTTYAAMAAAWVAVVSRWPDGFPARSYLTLACDLTMTTAVLWLSGSRAPFFFPVYLWIIVGNGLRFGERHLLAGLMLGLSGFGLLLAKSSYWQEHMGVGAGLLFSILVLPLFFLSVLRRLHDLNAKLAVELEHSRAAEKSKGEFLANMSHEIRTPMTGVLGMAEVLADSRPREDQRESLHVIIRSAESLLNIINDILDYSKIDSGRLTLEHMPFDLEQVLLDVHLLLKPTAEEKGLALTLTYPEGDRRAFIGDPTRVRQIVFNLVGNALKFTEQGGVEVKCRVRGSASSPLIVLEVSDTGIGIRPDRLEAVFEQFEQAEASTGRRFGGTGLGLAIGRQLATMMGGGLAVTSSYGHGSTFTAQLALPPADPSAVPATTRQDSLPHFGLRALVVDDNPFNRLVVQKMLARVGITADLAVNGREAVEGLSPEHDLVLMDVRMPVMSGFEATAAIRARGDELARVPVIALTADAGAEDAARCAEAGMDAHLGKPLRLNELVDVVSALKLSARVGV
jgi:signal transduction histidine kinase/CheY-like chemotaxis protein